MPTLEECVHFNNDMLGLEHQEIINLLCKDKMEHQGLVLPLCIKMARKLESLEKSVSHTAGLERKLRASLRT